MLGLNSLHAAIVFLDLNLIGIDNGAETIQMCDLVLLEKHSNATGQCLNGTQFLTHEFFQIQADTAAVDATFAQISGVSHMIVVGVVEKGLGGNAAHIKAGATKGVILFHTNGLEEKI